MFHKFSNFYPSRVYFGFIIIIIFNTISLPPQTADRSALNIKDEFSSSLDDVALIDDEPIAAELTQNIELDDSDEVPSASNAEISSDIIRSEAADLEEPVDSPEPLDELEESEYQGPDRSQPGPEGYSEVNIPAVGSSGSIVDAYHVVDSLEDSESEPPRVASYEDLMVNVLVDSQAPTAAIPDPRDHRVWGESSSVGSAIGEEMTRKLETSGSGVISEHDIDGILESEVGRGGGVDGVSKKD